MKSFRLGQRRRVGLFMPAVACILGMLLATPHAHALNADTVEIIGGRFPAGQAFLNFPVRIVNSEILSEISVPLELRELTPGAFINSLNITFSERLGGPFILPDGRRTDQFADTVGATSCGYVSPDFTDGATHTVASSPEGVWVFCSGDLVVEHLPPGADPVGTGSINVGFSLTNFPGMFEIDTVCVEPGGPLNHLVFSSPDAGIYTPVFKKGFVRLNGPPVARDTTIYVTVNDIVTGTLPASDPNSEDTLLFSVVVPPALGSLDIDSTGNYLFSAPGTDGSVSFDYRVDDGLVIDEGTVTIIIEPLPPDTLYVRKTGSDATGDGSPLNPFRTIPHAISVTNSGDLIIVGAGTYDAPGEVPIVFPLARTLTIRSEDGPFVTELVGTPGASGSVVVMDIGNQTDSVTIDGFTVRDNVVSAGVCSYCAGGITVTYPTVAHIVNCIIRDNTGFETAGGIHFDGSAGSIINNWISGNSGPSGSAVGGVEVDASAVIPIVNNTIVGNSGPGPGGVAGIRLNDFTLAGYAAGVGTALNTSVTRFDNNIIAFNTPGYGALAQAIGSTQTLNNLYFGNDGSPQGFSSLLTWILSDPLLKDAPAGDLHLTCGSPAIGTAELSSLPAALGSDIDGQPRFSPGLDIGADQFYDENKVARFVANPVSGCAPLSVDFFNLSTCDDEQWHWDFGDGGTSTDKQLTHEFLTAGTFEVRLIALGEYDADTTYDTVVVQGPLDVTFVSPQPQGCVPFQASFTAFADADAELFTWDFGDGDVDTGQQVTHTYASVGLYTVSVTATNSCSTFTHTKPDYIKVKTSPVVQISSSFDTVVGAPCNPFAVQFHYTSDEPIVAWNWDFGDNGTSTDSTPLHIYAEGDTFSVRLIATGECGTGQDVNLSYIRLRPRPIASPSATPTFACLGQTAVVFSPNVTGNFTGGLWLFGDGATGPGPSANHVYTQTGRYLPKLVLTSVCGVDTFPLADSITVGSVPTAAFSVSADSGYEPFSTQFTDTSSNLPVGWLYRFGDGGTSTLQHPSHGYAAGIFQASLIASNPCGSDTSADRRIVVGSFRPPVIDSLGTSGDTVLYSILIDSLVIGYDHTVTLNGLLTPLPVQGSMTFIFDPPSGVPPFSSVLRAIPSLNLATGSYSIEVRAVDSTRFAGPGQPVTRTTTRAFPYVGFTALQVTPSPIVMDSTSVAQGLTSRSVTVRNVSTPAKPYTLIVQPAQISGPPFEILPGQGQGATLSPGQSFVWTLGFRPTRKGDFIGSLTVRSNDPADPILQVPITGRGIGEQVPPKVTTASPAQNGEATIDQVAMLTFSEDLVDVSLDTILSVQSKRANSPVAGDAQLVLDEMVFTPDEWFWPDDTITVRLRAIVTDTNGNRLDGNGDGIETGSPDDDYVLTFLTGPGVFPGDANHDGFVNEADVLPIGRFWRLQGPPRDHPYTSFTIQPARAFPTRVAAHADCDGNGIVDSADICPIAEFFDRDTVLPKTIVSSWFAEANSWSSTTIDALLGALIDCPNQGPGNAILREVLSAMQNQSPVPAEYALTQNYPNPFNSATVISFSLAQPGVARLDIYDILGRRITTLAQGHMDAGTYRVVWDGRDEDEREVASGIYFYRVNSGRFTETRKMLLLK